VGEQEIANLNPKTLIFTDSYDLLVKYFSKICGKYIRDNCSSFPSKSFILEKWKEFIISNNRTPEDINKNSVICSCHFKPESFIVHNRYRILQKHAVPTIIISRVKCVSSKVIHFIENSLNT